MGVSLIFEYVSMGLFFFSGYHQFHLGNTANATYYALLAILYLMVSNTYERRGN